MTITINNTKLFINFINAITKITSNCLFRFTPTEVTVCGYDSNQTIRFEYKTNTATSSEQKEFCLSEINNLSKLLDANMSITKSNNCIIDIKNNALVCNNGTTFKLRFCEEAIIQKNIAQPIKSTFIDLCTINAKREILKHILSYHSLVDTDSNIYITQDNDKVNIDLYKKSNELSNRIGFPLGNVVSGNIEKPIVLDQTKVSLFSTLPNDTIKIILTDKNVVRIEDKIQNDNYFINYIIYCSLKKD